MSSVLPKRYQETAKHGKNMQTNGCRRGKMSSHGYAPEDQSCIEGL